MCGLYSLRGSAAYHLDCKLHLLQSAIQSWNKERYHNKDKNLILLYKERHNSLENIQAKIMKILLILSYGCRSKRSTIQLTSTKWSRNSIGHKKQSSWGDKKYQILPTCCNHSQQEKAYIENSSWKWSMVGWQAVILQVYFKEFCRRFIKDHQLLTQEAVPLSKDISEVDNDWLIRPALEEDVD